MTAIPVPAPDRAIDLRHIDDWVFDLDNTLYPADCNLFAQIDARMAAFIETRLGLGRDDARRLQKDYYARYGTTLAGLMAEHNVTPDAFMDFVHDIDLDVVEPNAALARAIEALPGRKLILTNGSVRHAERVAAKLGIDHCFEAIFDIEAADYTPKPHRQTYERFVAAHALAPAATAMFEDIAENLRAPFSLGMTTVLVCSKAAWIADEPDARRPAAPGEIFDHVHHATDDLAAFLETARIRVYAAPAEQGNR